MTDISNNTLAILVFAALAVVLAGTLFTFGGGITGFATTDSGNVTLVINDSLNIAVDTGNNSIAYGGCSPRIGSAYTCATNDSLVCDGVAGNNCTGDTGAVQYIRVTNVGNVNASVNVTTNCVAANLIGGTSPAFQYVTTHCEGTNTSSWTSLISSAPGTYACRNLAKQGVGQGFRLYTNVTIPQDAVAGSGCSGTGRAILMFTAVLAP